MNEDNVFDTVMEGLRQLPPDQRKKAFAQIRKERSDEEKARRDATLELPNTHWSKAHLLRRIPNPTNEAYEQKIHVPEFTFMGVGNQPDYGEVLMTFYPRAWTMELKSVKEYKDAFRDTMASYERLANVMYDDLMAVFEPRRLRLMMRLRPRGGIASCLTIDSDWAIRGGKEEFGDWRGNVDAFGFGVSGSVIV